MYLLMCLTMGRTQPAEKWWGYSIQFRQIEFALWNIVRAWKASTSLVVSQTYCLLLIPGSIVRKPPRRHRRHRGLIHDSSPQSFGIHLINRMITPGAAGGAVRRG